MTNFKIYFITFLLISVYGFSQTIPANEVIAAEDLINYLTPEVKAKLSKEGAITEASLAQYFRDKFSERYFFDYKDIDTRFQAYNTIYTGVEKSHEENAKDHMGKYLGPAQWKLPFDYLNGTPVNAYALRHLARQHKMVDVAYQYYYQNKDPKYITYFKDQLQSLNGALQANEFEKIEDGNGVYEVFRSGYRVLNWLQIHNLFLGQEAYTDKDQLTTIATLLQHGAHLFQHNPEFASGNHQTRGMSALAMISMLFRDFKDTDTWYEHSMLLLEQHMSKEINDDGFQFERSIHYHMSDIDNYFYVYQLAKISELTVKPFWKERLKSLFITLTKIAYPNKTAPVLSDDTDNPWATYNDISGALTLGYLLFESPKIGHFANDHVERKMFWYVTNSQLKMLTHIEAQAPTMKSVEFPTTGYYVMREGWNPEDKMMVISAGLDADKPDHQHGDMLGIQAMAHGKVMLPNYQVRYSLEDYGFFKNSMVKNVALVDDELQGKQYTSNQGGSGFGKFLELPQPKVIAWKKNENSDIFIGSHNGFEKSGVRYSRQVIYLKDDFWVVKDNFSSAAPHDYKQVWQGHYSLEEAPNLIRASFDNASGLDIYQLKKADTISTSGARGKQWTVVTKKEQSTFSFISIVYPYQGYANRIDENKEKPSFKEWVLNDTFWKSSGEETYSLSKEETAVFFSVNKLEFEKIVLNFSIVSDLMVTLKDKKLSVQAIGEHETELSFKNKSTKKSMMLKPGETVELSIK
ncbi:heparinase II/III family protein [Cellulophaga baltica]|uniref:Heparinase n=1 Tax=Cellulophaga baltica 18 TaxID=1348584 RepID=A0AAU8RJX5_9FLAO|nr:heparinase II/III family protein [Cellulophaga baltica]AIZ43554.1 heparinase [Cellulophaga baltica 18]